MRRASVGMAGLAIAIGSAASAQAAAGDLDPSFDDDGKVTLIDDRGFVARAVTVQPDGRIVVAGGSCVPGASGDGTCRADGASSFRLARFTSSGGLDANFGDRGVVTTPINGARSQAYDVLTMASGEIWAGGVAHDPGTNRDAMALVRYDAAGRVIGEPHLFPVGSGFSAIADLAPGPGGTVYAAGQVDGHFVVARLLADGTPDPAFGAGKGWIDAGPADGYGYGLGVVATKDGGAVAAGIAGDAVDATASYRFGLVRLDAAGTVVAGFTRLPVGTSSSFANAAIPTADGGWLAAGAATSDSAQAMALVRGTADGLATSWARLVPVPRDAVANDLALLPDGRIAVAGQVASDTSGSAFGVARLTAAGEPDPLFGAGGFSVIDWGRYARATAVAVQADGRIVSAGVGCNGGTADGFCTGGTSVLLLARQLSDPPPLPLTPTPTPTPTPTATPTPGPRDVTKPKGRLSELPKRVRRTTLRRKGIRVRVRSSEPVRLDLRLTGVRRGTRRRAVTLAHVQLRTRRRDVTVRLRPPREALRRAKAGPLTVAARITDAAGNAVTVRAHLRLR